ncbi:MAG: hypothetical protein Q7J70_01830 [Thermodesulfovibrionales bacterium]|nr:hypothetical protein [Thermodesulfovibrionales bacterium]
MNRKLMAVALSILFVVAFACKKKEQQPIPQALGMPPAMGVLPQELASPQGHQMMSGGKLQVVVPDNVKGKWNSVKVLIEEKDTKKVQEYTVKLNSEWKIPGSNLKVTVGEFLPDFTMDGDKITSGSSELNNPAVGIKVTDGEKQIFPAQGKQWGWLWSRKELQSAHPFEHPKYNILLKEPVKKG